MGRMLRTDEVARRIGVSPRTLRKWACLQRKGLHTGHAPLPFEKIGRMLVLSEKDLERWLAVEFAANSAD